jgi:hypothetical protein
MAAAQMAGNDFDIVLPEPIEPKRLIRWVKLSVGSDFRITMLGGPMGYVGVKTLAIFYHRGEQSQIATLLEVAAEKSPHLIACLSLDGELTIRTVLRAQPREQQPQEVINLGDGGDGAFSPAASVSLFDANGRRQAGNQIDVGPGKLLDELAGISAHGIKEAPLAFSEKEIESEGAFAGATHSGNHHKLVSGNRNG